MKFFIQVRFDWHAWVDSLDCSFSCFSHVNRYFLYLNQLMIRDIWTRIDDKPTPNCSLFMSKRVWLSFLIVDVSLFSGHTASVDINHYPHGMHYLCELTSMKFGSDISFVYFLSTRCIMQAYEHNLILSFVT